MKVTKRQLKRIIREEKARLLSEAMTMDDLLDEMEDMGSKVTKLYTALDSGGYETLDKYGPDQMLKDQLRMTLENIQYELDQFQLKVKQ